MNLHLIANSVIRNLHPNIDVVVVRSLGTVNSYGVLKAAFGDCEHTFAQKQSSGGDELKLENEAYEIDIVRSFFISVKGRPLIAGQRNSEDGSDFLYETKSGSLWRVFNISDDYHLSGWTMVQAAMQSAAPDGVLQALKDSGLLSAAEQKLLTARFSNTGGAVYGT